MTVETRMIPHPDSGKRIVFNTVEKKKNEWPKACKYWQKYWGIGSMEMGSVPLGAEVEDWHRREP